MVWEGGVVKNPWHKSPYSCRKWDNQQYFHSSPPTASHNPPLYPLGKSHTFSLSQVCEYGTWHPLIMVTKYIWWGWMGWGFLQNIVCWCIGYNKQHPISPPLIETRLTTTTGMGTVISKALIPWTKIHPAPLLPLMLVLPIPLPRISFITIGNSGMPSFFCALFRFFCRVGWLLMGWRVPIQSATKKVGMVSP